MEPKPRRGLEYSHALNARCQRCGVALRRNRYQWVREEASGDRRQASEVSDARSLTPDTSSWLLVCRDTLACRLRVKAPPR